MMNDVQSFSGSGASSASVKIRIVGVGGAGSNAVNGLKVNSSETIELSIVNTDAQALLSSPIAKKMGYWAFDYPRPWCRWRR